MLQIPVWDDQYVGMHRGSGEKILVLTWWCFAVGGFLNSDCFACFYPEHESCFLEKRGDVHVVQTQKNVRKKCQKNP